MKKLQKGIAAGVWLAAWMLLLSGNCFCSEAQTEELLLPGETELVTESAPALAEDVSEGAQVPEETEAQEVVTKGLHFASDYEEVFKALQSAQNYRYRYNLVEYALEDSTIGIAPTASAEAVSDTAMKAAGSAGKDYSGTNLRDENVDEADIVKTDGTYIYVLRKPGSLQIIEAAGAESTYLTDMDLTADIDNPEDTLEAKDMYVDGDTLVVVFSKNARAYDWRYNWRDMMHVRTYDISDRTAPVLLGSVEQDGSCSQSRKVGDKVYLYSTEYFDLYNDSYSENKKYIIPHAGGKELEAEVVCIPDFVTDSAYLIMSSFSTKEPDRLIDSKVMISGAENLYVTTQSAYVINQDYESSQGRTEIVRFALEDGMISGKAAARVKGTVNDTFSIDEYEGNLRVLTTYIGSETGALLEAISDLFGLGYYADDHWVRHNALYILDENLQRRARLSDIAKNEEVRSARFFGDTVYFVTFENTDPLFTADLSDPDHPVLTGELKVSGFSSYLHPYGDGLLLGIGYEADEMTGTVTGLKLSMFDISDPVNVKELHRYVLDGITWCPAIDDYKAILASGAKNLIGFFCDQRYMVFTYDKDSGFSRIVLYDFYEDMLNGRAQWDSMRGLYIGNELYLAGADFAVGFDMGADTGFEKNLVLKNG